MDIPSPMSREDTHPLVLTPNGSHHSTYDWQVGSTHPTGMLSCFHDEFNWLETVLVLFYA